MNSMKRLVTVIAAAALLAIAAGTVVWGNGPMQLATIVWGS